MEIMDENHLERKMNIEESLRLIADDINKHYKNFDSFIRRDVANIMICIEFSDGKKHFIIPEESAVRRLAGELFIIIDKNAWEKTRENFRKSEFIPLISEKEMEL